jgi:hypothetical protein
MLIETKWSRDTGAQDKSVQLTVERGQTYFVRCHNDVWGFMLNSRLQVVPKVVALYEIEGLKELPGSPVENVKEHNDSIQRTRIRPRAADAGVGHHYI